MRDSNHSTGFIAPNDATSIGRQSRLPEIVNPHRDRFFQFPSINRIDPERPGPDFPFLHPDPLDREVGSERIPETTGRKGAFFGSRSIRCLFCLDVHTTAKKKKKNQSGIFHFLPPEL